MSDLQALTASADCSCLADRIADRIAAEGELLDNLKSEFITTISHELRTPLSVILLSAEMLKLHGQNCPEVQRQTYISQIHHAAKQINTLFNEALLTIGADLC